MIVMGYPGIGKTTFAKQYGSHAIDLESSLFQDDFHRYVQVALDLEKQGYVVFVSCHDKVRQELLNLAPEDVLIAVCYPDVSLKDAWNRRLRIRLNVNHSAKNERAYRRFLEHFEDDIKKY